jgi:NAD(P)-dependent dehydrogenase (short-subunit alcohol dehydrogenase family)
MTSNGKIAVVTGAGTGIGKSTALALLNAGYSVALAGRRKELLDETAQEAGASSSRALVVPTDVSRPEAVSALFASVKENFHRLDLLFNNAGIAAGGPIEDIPFETWQRVVDVNLTGVFLCTQEAVRLMKSQSPRGGRIINNGSISAHVPRPDSSPYTATKHAVTGLTRSTSLDGRKYDIVCGQIDIGNARTELAENMMSGGVTQADGTVGVEPFMNVEDVAEAVLYMANLSLDSNVQFMTVMASKMPFIGRG